MLRSCSLSTWETCSQCPESRPCSGRRSQRGCSSGRGGGHRSSAWRGRRGRWRTESRPLGGASTGTEAPPGPPPPPPPRQPRTGPARTGGWSQDSLRDVRQQSLHTSIFGDSARTEASSLSPGEWTESSCRPRPAACQCPPSSLCAEEQRNAVAGRKQGSKVARLTWLPSTVHWAIIDWQHWRSSSRFQQSELGQGVTMIAIQWECLTVLK